MASTAQTKKIHTLLGKLGLDDETYRILLATYGVSTSKALTSKEAGTLITKLESHAIVRKYDNLGKRSGMATPAQLRMIERMWFDVTRQGSRTDALKALRQFINNRFNVLDMRFVSSDKVSKIVQALKCMKKQQIKTFTIFDSKEPATTKTAIIYDFTRYKKV